MAEVYRHDPAAYKAGDPIFVRVPAGWSEYKAVKLAVERVTPGGQIVATEGATTMRINARGGIVGAPDHSRRVCSAEEAAELDDEQRIRQAWLRVRDLGDMLVHASRQRSVAGVTDAIVKIAPLIADLDAQAPHP